MSYITIADVLEIMRESELIQLTDDAGTGAYNEALVNAAIADAEADIDSYARTRFTVPLQVSAKVKQLAKVLTRWHLELRTGGPIRETTKAGYDAALVFLKDLAAGRAQLDQPLTAAPQSGGQLVRTTEKEEIFSDDNLDKF